MTIIWRDITTGEKTKTETDMFFNNRLEAEAELISYKIDGNNYPTAILVSPTNQYYFLDPHYFYIRISADTQ